MKTFFYFFFLFLAVVIAPSVYGADAGITYTSLANVPGLEGTHFTTEGYVNALYYLSITFGGLLAVIQIIYGGVEWTFSDAFTEKSSAKARITGALFGLLIILTAVLLLETINKNLTTLNIFSNAPEVTITDNNNSVTTDTRTACQKNANSKECCDQRGGNFILSSSASRCSVGSAVVQPVIAGETPEQKRIFCESIAGRIWRDGTCRETAGREIAFPPGYTDADGKDDTDRMFWCAQAVHGNYNLATHKCISTQ